jgi:hypothetical protein
MIEDGSLPIRFIDDVEDAERFLEALAEQSRKPLYHFYLFFHAYCQRWTDFDTRDQSNILSILHGYSYYC